MPEATPTFAVVGHVNKGKSSIVSSLIEDETVRVERVPGTTLDCQEFSLSVDGTVLYRLVDTPGFQDAPRALEWLQAHCPHAADRPQAVRQFVETYHHDPSGQFLDECRLLRPILDGAAIIYVVDGSLPYHPSDEAGMEILCWTGAPRMALINQISTDDHRADWRRALDQYFSLVRDCNAYEAGFAKRLELLEAFRQLSDAWRPRLDHAISVLKTDWTRRQQEAARILARQLADMLTYQEERTFHNRQELEENKDAIESSFLNALRKREQRARQEVQTLYHHEHLELSESELERPTFAQDLFATAHWRHLGLSRKQLFITGVLTGATIGGTIDAMVGGASFMTGAVIGSLAGGGYSLYAMRGEILDDLVRWTLLDRNTLSRLWHGTRRFRVGPIQSPNFAWVILGRAILHARAIRDRAHARREQLTLPMNSESVFSHLSQSELKVLQKTILAVQNAPDDPEEFHTLTRTIAAFL